MSYLILSDIHLHNWSQFASVDGRGVNTRLKIILDNIGEAVDFEDRQTLYIAGDLFHVRGNIPPSVLNPTLDLFGLLINQGVKIRIIPGNHDLEGKHSNELSSAVTALKHLGVTVCNQSQYFDDDNVVMIPWYDKLDDLKTEMKRMASLHPMSDCIIHAPLNGVIKGIPDHGMDPWSLKKETGFKRIFCGHYHNHVDFGQGVYSIGALTHQTWGDVGTTSGYIEVTDGGVVHHMDIAPRFIDFPIELSGPSQAAACDGNYVRVRTDVEMTEKEINELRDLIMNEYNAAGCIIQAQVKSKSASRVAAVKTGVTLEESVEDYVSKQGKLTESERKELSVLCADIMQTADKGEV